jgi:hypothetical protein
VNGRSLGSWDDFMDELLTLAFVIDHSLDIFVSDGTISNIIHYGIVE